MKLARSGRRATSEIIGGLLMVLITVSIGVAVVAGSSSELNSVTASFLNLISNNSKTLADNMNVEQVQFASGLGSANLFVRDFGTTSLHVASIYIIFASNNTLATRVVYSPTILFQPGSFLELTVTYSFRGGTPYTFIIVARDSSEVSITAIA